MDEELAFATSRIGSVLSNKYELEGLIGLGGMAVVYRGRHRKNGNRVAIKMLHPAFSRHKEVSARFLKEGYVANSVDHPGTVRVLDDDIADDGSVYLVMDLLEGETFEARRKRLGGTLDAYEVIALAVEVLTVLGAAHEKGIVHRDIKPENLFLMNAGSIRVLDFGIARARSYSVTVTRTGVLMGTPGYLPPEQAQGLTREIDGRTDLWALGAVMFTLLTGEYVHLAETPQQMIIFTATRPPRALAEVAPNLPPDLLRVVDRALAFKKEDRYETAADMQAALRAIPGYEPLALMASMSRISSTAPLSTARGSPVDKLAAEAITAVEVSPLSEDELPSNEPPSSRDVIVRGTGMSSVPPRSSDPITSTMGDWPPRLEVAEVRDTTATGPAGQGEAWSEVVPSFDMRGPKTLSDEDDEALVAAAVPRSRRPIFALAALALLAVLAIVALTQGSSPRAPTPKPTPSAPPPRASH